MELEKIIDKNLDDMFWDIYNSRTEFLRNKSEEYRKVQNRILELSQIDSLRLYFDNQEIKSLDEDDAKLILEYINLLEDRTVLEMKDMFYVGLAMSKHLNDKLEIILSDLSE